MNTEMDFRVSQSTGNLLTELPLLSIGLCSMELGVMLYGVCVWLSATALFLCNMGYALSYDTVTFYYFSPQNLN